MRENLSAGFQNRSDTNQSVQPQSIVKSSKFQIEKKEASYYLLGENKGTDLLAFTCIYCTADLYLCLNPTCKTPVFSSCGTFCYKFENKKLKNDLSKYEYEHQVLSSCKLKHAIFKLKCKAKCGSVQ